MKRASAQVCLFVWNNCGINELLDSSD